MGGKKGFKVYYLLLCEGTTEFNVFAYLTTKRYRECFTTSRIQFSNKVEIIKDGTQIISQGKLGGVGSLRDFKARHSLIKKKYADQTLFFVLDRDLDDSPEIEAFITKRGDIVQFVTYNSEHLLMRLAKKNPKDPSQFSTMNDFRSYCKQVFFKEFKKDASEFKDIDFEKVFNKSTDNEIRNNFTELFATLEQ